MDKRGQWKWAGGVALCDGCIDVRQAGGMGSGVTRDDESTALVSQLRGADIYCGRPVGLPVGTLLLAGLAIWMSLGGCGRDRIGVSGPGRSSSTNGTEPDTSHCLCVLEFPWSAPEKAHCGQLYLHRRNVGVVRAHDPDVRRLAGLPGSISSACGLQLISHAGAGWDGGGHVERVFCRTLLLGWAVPGSRGVGGRADRAITNEPRA